tara:strand:+ start:1903 stop:2223 length:321 start_codon:yes stop_codon:yes gene_type:complete
MNDFTKMFSQAKKIQEKIKDAQENIKKIEVEGISGGKLVTLTLNGDGELKKIFFDPNLMKEKKEIIEDLVLAAHNDAKAKLKKKTSDAILDVTGGMQLPEGFNFPF